MRVVIVEDEEIIRNGLIKLLGKINKDVEIVGSAEDGEVGLEIIEKVRPDLVITDIRMPKMDGIEMLGSVAKMGITHKTIVLSAYSEFEYAQKAIKLGVSEYILKPISIQEIAQSLKKITNQLNYEQNNKLKNPERLFNLKHIFQSSLFEELIIDGDIEKLLKENYKISVNDIFEVFVIYLGNKYEQYHIKIENDIKIILNDTNNFEFKMLELPSCNEIVMIFFNFKIEINLLEYVNNSLRPRINYIDSNDMVLGYMRCEGILALKDIIHKLNKELHWNIVLESNDIVNYPEVLKKYTLPISYPIAIEKELKTVVCTMQLNKIDKIIDKFIHYCKDIRGNPKGIKENFVRFAWIIISFTKEIDETLYSDLDSQQLLTNIMSAITWNELEGALKILIQKNNHHKDVSSVSCISLLVKRSQCIIHEFYNKGITLDEIALKLGVTPEYLSTQFKKEIGESFSAYIRSYRINKAKKLLISTELKLYQISEQVGYNDPKYFSKVFKENTDQLPGEYRKIYK